MLTQQEAAKERQRTKVVARHTFSPSSQATPHPLQPAPVAPTALDSSGLLDCFKAAKVSPQLLRLYLQQTEFGLAWLTQTRTHTGTDTIQPTTMAESHANPLVKSGKRMATLLKI